LQHKIINDSFRDTPSDVIEALAMKAETNYERALFSRRTNPRKEQVLFYLCSTLWDVLALKERGKLTKNKDKEAFAKYLLFTTNL